jgi:hypothetical protein
MAKTRSPGYPTIGLREAIEKITLVYEKDYQNRLPRALVAEHMGYRSLNGKSLGVLSAVAKYGLLEGRGDENRVSDLALEIIAHPPGTAERARAVGEAAGRPELFSELDTQFQGGKVSDAAIRSFLITRKFIPAAADMSIRAYRETKALVQEEGGRYDADHAAEVEVGDSVSTAFGESPPRDRALMSDARVVPGEREYLRGPLSRNISYRLLVSGEIGASELGKIIRILTLQKEFIAEGTEEEDGPGGT